jgi:hypothetical protein
MDRGITSPRTISDKTPIERLSVFPRQPDMFWYGVRLVVHVLLRAWLKVWHRYRVIGREHIPRNEPFVMVANHASHLDALCLLSALPLRSIQKTYPAAAKDYFFTTMPKVAFSAIVVNAMPFDRKENPRASIDLCRELPRSTGPRADSVPRRNAQPDRRHGAVQAWHRLSNRGDEHPGRAVLPRRRVSRVAEGSARSSPVSSHAASASSPWFGERGEPRRVAATLEDAVKTTVSKSQSLKDRGKDLFETLRL